MLSLNSDKSFALNEAGFKGYPLCAGNTWSYRGSIEWVSENGTVKKDKATSAMEVMDTVKIGSTEIIKVKGSPNGLKLQDTGVSKENKFNEDESAITAPGYGENHVIIRTADETYYDIDSELMNSVYSIINGKNTSGKDDIEQSLRQLFKESASPFLELPLSVGKSFGNISTINRDDGMYCWVVKKEENVDLASIKGLESFGVRKQYTLRFATFPDETEVDFVPGVGITGYRYKHNGSALQYNMRLTGAEILQNKKSDCLSKEFRISGITVKFKTISAFAIEKTIKYG
jgi:hypothetical protein